MSNSQQRFLAALDYQRRTLASEIEGDVAPFRGMTPDQLGKLLASVCRDAWAILKSRADFDRAVKFRDPLSRESQATWLRLVKAHRESR